MKRLFMRFRDLKIANKLFLLVVCVNLVALFFSGSFLAIYTWQTLRSDVLEKVKTRAEIACESNFTASLTFLDRKAALDALKALTADEDTVASAVYDKDGKIFAVYPELTGELESAAAGEDEHSFLGNDLLLVKYPIILDNEKIGSLILEYSLRGIKAKFGLSLVYFSGILFTATLLICLLASFLNREIVRPIQALTALTLKIVKQGDYSVRAQPWGGDEIGELTQHVNVMLAQIESRDAKLAQYNKELEKIVAKRTEQLEQINRNLEFKAKHDGLTRLPNRVLFADRLQQAIFGADRNRTKVGILFVDLDYFKQINDTYGHEAGDQVLLQVAERMEACTRSVDTVCRFAGDEFTLLLPNIGSTEDLSRVAAKVTEELARPVIFKLLSLQISASIGGAIYPDDAGDTEMLLQAADVAMYHAKKQGRNCFQLFCGAVSEIALKRQQLQSDLKNAVANDEFVVLYQPIFDLQTGQVDSMETLLRWQHPQLGLLAPDSFLSVAKESGLISEIDKLMLLKVCEQQRKWRDKGYSASLRINLALRDFLSNDFFELFFELMANRMMDPAMLSIEIEESVLRNDTPQIARSLSRLKESPVSISIDNFGTEHASLVTLMRGGVQYVKIDRSYFRSNIVKPEHSRIIQALIVAMAHSLQVKVIAAGVEAEAQAEFLKKLGCDLVQGFLYYKPMRSSEAEHLLPKLLLR